MFTSYYQPQHIDHEMIYKKELFYNEYMIEIMLYFALINCERLRLLEIYVVNLN